MQAVTRGQNNLRSRSPTFSAVNLSPACDAAQVAISERGIQIANKNKTPDRWELFSTKTIRQRFQSAQTAVHECLCGIVGPARYRT
jgi:hypothetical protein